MFRGLGDLSGVGRVASPLDAGVDKNGCDDTSDEEKRDSHAKSDNQLVVVRLFPDGTAGWTKKMVSFFLLLLHFFFFFFFF